MKSLKITSTRDRDHPTRTHRCEDRRAWYDPHTRHWILQTVDPDEHQLGDAEYTLWRKRAMDFLKPSRKP